MAPNYQFAIPFHTLSEAYERLEIKNNSISDGDVVAAFHKLYEKEDLPVHLRQPWALGALQVISRDRQSQLLAFVLTIIPHLTRENVSLLATPPNSAPVRATPSEVIEVGSGDDRTIIPTPASSSDHDVAASTPDNIPLPSDQDSSMSVSTVSTSEDSTESDFDNYIGGKFWEGANWRCEECNDELVEGKRPNGDVINPCRLCGRAREGECGALCDGCHGELGHQCSGCADKDSNSDEDPSEDWGMIKDGSENVWRCTDCLWEIEADGENEGQCHCLVESDDPNAERFAYPIDLSYYDDYEPADSDSSGPDSTDSEPDSEDEAFIEDDGPFRREMLSLYGFPYPPVAAQFTETSTTTEKGDGFEASQEPESMDIM